MWPKQARSKIAAVSVCPTSHSEKLLSLFAGAICLANPKGRVCEIAALLICYGADNLSKDNIVPTSETTTRTAAEKSFALRFRFFKGAEDTFAAVSDDDFDWKQSAAKTRELLGDAMNARHLSFLLGSGCSSYLNDGEELGIPTMAPLAKEFLTTNNGGSEDIYPRADEVDAIRKTLGIDIVEDEYAKNLERLMEVLFSAQFILKRSTLDSHQDCLEAVDSLISKIAAFICEKCNAVQMTLGETPVVALYQSFYRRLIFRDRNLPPPWVFTTNYDLFNEIALDRLGTPYCNGFSGTVERRFNPATYRYSLAEQLDISNRKWTSVDGYLYLCKLHGSINWMEEGSGLFPIREIAGSAQATDRVMIYPTPTKQNASFGSPYSDLFREFQSRVVREQSLLVVLGYSFGDEHINNLLFQALTVPTFRMIAFVSPNMGGVVEKLKALQDPRVWLIGGDGIETGRQAHYFDTFVESFMPEPPGSKVENAVEKIVTELLGRASQSSQPEPADEE